MHHLLWLLIVNHVLIRLLLCNHLGSHHISSYVCILLLRSILLLEVVVHSIHLFLITELVWLVNHTATKVRIELLHSILRSIHHLGHLICKHPWSWHGLLLHYSLLGIVHVKCTHHRCMIHFLYFLLQPYLASSEVIIESCFSINLLFPAFLVTGFSLS